MKCSLCISNFLEEISGVGCSVVSDSLRPHGMLHTRLPRPSLLSPRVCANTCPSHRWCHPAISSSVAPFSCCPQSFPASGSFPMSWHFPSGDQNTQISACSISPSSNYSGLISLKIDWFDPFAVQGLSRDHSLDYMELCQQSLCFSTHSLDWS